MLKKIWVPIFISLVMALSACSQEQMMNNLVPKDEITAAKATLGQLNALELDRIIASMDNNLKTPELAGMLKKMAELLPDETPKSEKIVGYQVNTINGVTIKNITFEFEFEKTWILANVATRYEATNLTIVGMSVVPAEHSLADLNGFALTGKSVMHYLLLIATVCVPVVIIFALYVCIKTPIARKKWAWILFIAFGFGKLSIQWTSGAIGFSLLSAQLLGAGAVSQLYGPWVLSVSLPIGAVLFLIKRRQLDARNCIATIESVEESPREAQ